MNRVKPKPGTLYICTNDGQLQEVPFDAMTQNDKISLDQAIEFEVYSRNWVQFISIPFLQDLISLYLAWRARRKFKRYERNYSAAQALINKIMRS
jgi:hypothetical protein